MPIRRAPLRVLALALTALLLAACGSLPQTTLEPQSGNAREIYGLLEILLIAAAIVFVLVEGILIITILRFRERRREEGLASDMHGNTKLEIAWTIAPALLVAFLAAVTYQTQAKVADFPEDSLTITAVGHQWWWEFKYPDGTVTANELHIPATRNVQINLEAVDVIHSFWVPRLMGKTDMIPGHTNKIWFNADSPGIYEAQCAEFCGEQHALMRFKVIVQEPAQYEAWVAAMKVAPPAPPQSFNTKACIACHSVNATQNNPQAPNLRDFGSRLTIAAGAAPNTSENLQSWLRDPEVLKSGNFMTTLIKPGHLNDQEIAELIAYLQSLKVQ